MGLSLGSGLWALALWGSGLRRSGLWTVDL
jgi:hypothetical protein